MPDSLPVDPRESFAPAAPDPHLRRRLAVRGAFLAVLAGLSVARVVPMPAVAVLPLAVAAGLLYGAVALGLVDARRSMRYAVPAVDLLLLYVLVAYTPEPHSWGALAYVWLAGQAVVSEARHPSRWLPLYALAAWLTLALASIGMAAPVAYMAGHTVALTLFTAVAGTILRERLESRLDPLTGALGRRGGLMELERRLERRRPFKVALVDLRDFKRINDTYGHAAGDQALRVIGRRLHHTLRDDDAVIRYGGDEFVIASEIDDLEERVSIAFRDPLKTRFGTFDVTADIGVMPWHHGLALADILAEADRRMYATKRAN